MVKYSAAGFGARWVRHSARFLTGLTLFLPLLSGCGGSSSGNSSAAIDGAPPSVSLSASSTLVDPGGTVSLRWSSAGADGCTASGGWSGSRPLNGSEVVGPLPATTTYTLSCSGSGGGSVRQVTIAVNDGNGAWVQLSAAPPYVESGGTSTLSWNATGATGCTAGGGWTGAQPASGSFTVGPIDATTTYQLNCEGPDGNGVGMVTVEVVDKILRWQAPTQNVDGSPLDDLSGYVIYWGAASRAYTGSHTINSATVTEWESTVSPGTYYFAMTAFDSENNESGYSNEVRKIIP
jgi:hypothetical protein